MPPNEAFIFNKVYNITLLPVCEEMLQLEHLLCSAKVRRGKNVGTPYIHGVHVEVLSDFMNTKDILEPYRNH